MTSIIEHYFDAFNIGDTEGMLACLSDDIAHHVNEGGVRHGKDMFRDFCAHMEESYREELSEMVIFMSSDGKRGAAEYVVSGTYLKTDDGLPEADGQTYKLPAGSFFTIEDGLITRITTYYNLSDWRNQVS
ncbi:isopropylmalate/homocitrate/citramalate synthase [Pelagivirga sediminicola]|uniref:Isopropylmalate/homocitrate/citramalate synthase n=1 Tax=Pelagivirga sediminicola TaxID=2170575 RepID=A0A2T7G4Z9_9RHOB|nr:ketosteroid isomerase-related protein [Pelagivirga sediminicola]PVA09491.1 isopropylmalate/homocitrate/citramalate synthase [Pelagivirga sediminicola]